MKNKRHNMMWKYGLSEEEARRAIAEGRRMDASSGLVQCVVCGRDIQAKRAKTRKYCDIKCSNAAVKLGLRPPPPKKPRPVLEPLECAFCGEMYTPNRDLKGRSKFCSRVCKARHRQATPEHRADALRRYYMRRYGLTPEQAEAMKASGCAICGRTEVSGRWANNLHIDHNHDTGRVRGVLCHGCNTGLGQFQDDPVLLQRAIGYLTTG